MRTVRPTPYVLVGGLCGLTWAAGFRGWMAQLVWPESSYSWLTVVLVLLPGTAIGLLLGWAAFLRRVERRGSRWLVWSPVLFASALLDPEIARALVTNGQGGGALIVVATALSGGFVLSRTGWSAARVTCAVVSGLGLLVVFGMGGIAGPLTSARGAWVALYGWSFVLLFCLASVLPYPAVRASHGGRSFAALGALCGIAWACALRGFMAEVVGADSAVHWVNTWGFILLPGALIGALLGWAEHLRRTGGRPRWRLLALAPLLFAAILVRGLIEDPTTMFGDGIGAGTVAIPVLCIIGGHALSGRGPLWTRLPAGVVGAATLAAWPLTGTAVGGPNFALDTPRGVWATVLNGALLAIFALAASTPQRAVLDTTTTRTQEADHGHSAAV